MIWLIRKRWKPIAYFPNLSHCEYPFHPFPSFLSISFHFSIPASPRGWWPLRRRPCGWPCSARRGAARRRGRRSRRSPEIVWKSWENQGKMGICCLKLYQILEISTDPRKSDGTIRISNIQKKPGTLQWNKVGKICKSSWSGKSYTHWGFQLPCCIIKGSQGVPNLEGRNLWNV